MAIEFEPEADAIEKLVVLTGFYTAQKWGENEDSEERDEFIEQHKSIKQKEWALRGINAYRKRQGWEEIQLELTEEE